MKKIFPSINFLAKMTNLPILNKIFKLLLFKGDDIIYLPKDSVIEINKAVLTPNNYVLPSEILKYFIQKANYHFIMDFCICRESMECKDYPRDLGCLFLGKGVLDINPNLGRKVSKEEALEHLKRCRDAGLVHMIGRNLLDKQWLGVKEGRKLLSICNCCPCCCLWRVAPTLSSEIASRIKRIPGIKIEVSDECIGCGTCTEKNICFVEAIKIINKQAVISDDCRGCGRCIEVCPQNAIKLYIDDTLYIKKAIQNLEKIIDVA